MFFISPYNFSFRLQTTITCTLSLTSSLRPSKLKTSSFMGPTPNPPPAIRTVKRSSFNPISFLSSVFLNSFNGGSIGIPRTFIFSAGIFLETRSFLVSSLATVKISTSSDSQNVCRPKSVTTEIKTESISFFLFKPATTSLAKNCVEITTFGFSLLRNAANLLETRQLFRCLKGLIRE